MKIARGGSTIICALFLLLYVEQIKPENIVLNFSIKATFSSNFYKLGFIWNDNIGQ